MRVLSGRLSRLPHSPEYSSSDSDLVPFEITPQQVREQLNTGSIQPIDVREPHEYQTARIEGSELIPMGTVPARLTELEDRSENAMLVVYCHHGVRSLQVVNWLREQGVAACQSMAGGIDRW
ncbi:MAG TPA: rhodanese-like domain-containing protein, partial [Bryobacteraceae bacterium]|nr:rhodanese-like domain-containing protein [Bryobacteraceae bacterium]